ncbi:MAG: dihydrodipicolinate synthase family protein [Planctomycetaceae bacterium]|nr:dihydrodipicolinate synthase family protein [Planctomycetaceae bacterium]
MIRQIHGVIPVVHTPFLENGELDYESLVRELEWACSLEIDGLCTGMVSELLRLNDIERQTLHQWIGDFDRGDRAFVASVGAESTEQAVKYAQMARQAGADAVMAIPPTKKQLDAQGLMHYYTQILELGGLPLIVQDASGYVGNEIPLEVSTDLFGRFGAEKLMFKPEANPMGPRLSLLRDATGGEAKIFEGSGGISLMDSFHRGITGTIPGMEFLSQVLKVWQALQKNEIGKAYEYYLPLCALVSLQLQAGLDGFLAIEKYMMKRQGLFTTDLRRDPIQWEMDQETQQELERLLLLIDL